MLEKLPFIPQVLIVIGMVAVGVYALISLIKLIHAIYIGLHGTKHERDYSEFVQDLIKGNIRTRPKETIVGKTIIDEGRGGLNTKIRKTFYTKLKHLNLDPILISEFPRESERIAYILKQAVRETLYTELFLEDFLETLIVYMAYKFARREKRIGNPVERVLREELPKLKYFDHILKLDSSDWEAHIVLNPVPEKSLYLNIIYYQWLVFKQKCLRGKNMKKEIYWPINVNGSNFLPNGSIE